MQITNLGPVIMCHLHVTYSKHNLHKWHKLHTLHVFHLDPLTGINPYQGNAGITLTRDLDSIAALLAVASTASPGLSKHHAMDRARVVCEQVVPLLRPGALRASPFAPGPAAGRLLPAAAETPPAGGYACQPHGRLEKRAQDASSAHHEGRHPPPLPAAAAVDYTTRGDHGAGSPTSGDPAAAHRGQPALVPGVRLAQGQCSIEIGKRSSTTDK